MLPRDYIFKKENTQPSQLVLIPCSSSSIFFLSFLILTRGYGGVFCLLIHFRKKGKEREKEKHQHERETSIGYLPYVLPAGIESTT